MKHPYTDKDTFTYVLQNHYTSPYCCKALNKHGRTKNLVVQ